MIMTVVEEVITMMTMIMLMAIIFILQQVPLRINHVNITYKKAPHLHSMMIAKTYLATSISATVLIIKILMTMCMLMLWISSSEPTGRGKMEGVVPMVELSV